MAGTRRKWAAPGLVLQARHREEDGDAPRVGFTASRKVGNAVTRNRARRRLRALAGKIIPGHARNGFDFVLIARASTVNRPFAALLEDLETALKRVGAWRDSRDETVPASPDN